MPDKAIVIGDEATVAFYRTLGFEVAFYGSPDKENLAKAMGEFAKGTKEGDHPVFAYSGPGCQSKATRVVHIREVPPGWKTNPDYVYVGRPGKGLTSEFGNPFAIGPDGDRDEVLMRFGECIDRRMAEDPAFAAKVKGLEGKSLVCFCRPKEGFQGRLLCHAQILAGKATGLPPESFD